MRQTIKLFQLDINQLMRNYLIKSFHLFFFYDFGILRNYLWTYHLLNKNRIVEIISFVNTPRYSRMRLFRRYHFYSA